MLCLLVFLLKSFVCKVYDDEAGEGEVTRLLPTIFTLAAGAAANAAAATSACGTVARISNSRSVCARSASSDSSSSSTSSIY